MSDSSLLFDLVFLTLGLLAIFFLGVLAVIRCRLLFVS